MSGRSAEPAPLARGLAAEADDPVLDSAAVAQRLRAAEYGRVDRRRAELTTAIASLHASILRRRAELQADDVVLARMIDELAALDRADLRRAQMLAPAPPAYLTLGEACRVAGRSENTMRKLIRERRFAWKVDGRWRVSQPDLVAYLAGLPD